MRVASAADRPLVRDSRQLGQVTVACLSCLLSAQTVCADSPILNPEQYRVQTLRNVNLWFTLAPWIEAGLVEVIRTPADFNPKL